MTDRRHYGAKYDKTLRVKDVAKVIRSEIKDAVKAGTLPDLKYTVRSSSRSINVGVPGDAGLKNPTWHVIRAKFPHEYVTGEYVPFLTPEGKRVKELLERMLAEHNHDGSDLMTDYFDMKFYAFVDMLDDGDEARAKSVARYERGVELIGSYNFDWRNNPHGAVSMIEGYMVAADVTDEPSTPAHPPFGADELLACGGLY